MLRAFVVGNAAWDEALHLATLPAPGASVHVRRGAAGPGGKGLNQAVVLARAGVPTHLVAAIGRDAAGDAVAAALAEEGLADRMIRRDVATDWSGVLVSETGENAILTTREAAGGLDGEVIAAGFNVAEAGDLCVLQGNLELAATAATLGAARGRGMIVAFNPSPVDLRFAELLGQADVLFLNREEACTLAGDAAPAAVRALGAPRIVVTLGAEGALLVTPEGEAHVPAVDAAVTDPTGAGDVFMATALAHAAQRCWQVDAAALAAGAAAAALTVGRAGAYAALPTREELAAVIAGR